MINLIKAELLRLVSRRLLWVTMAALVVVTLLQTLLSMNLVAPLTERDYAQAQANYESELEYWEQWQAECEADAYCTDDWDMSTTSMEDYLRSVWSFEEFVAQQYVAGSWVLIFVVIFLTAVVVGADFTNGALSTQLTFTPRRTRVFVAKLIAGVSAGMMAVAVPILVGGVSSILVFISLRPPADLDLSMTAVALLGRFLTTTFVTTLFVGLMAMLLGSTLGALAGTAGVVVVSYFVSSMMWDSPSAQKFLPTNNFTALLEGSYTWWWYNSGLEESVDQVLIDFPQAVVYAGAVLVLLASAALLRFTRRDLLA